MRKMIGGFAAALLVVLPALAADSGPAVNESIPMLHVDAFNDGDAGAYCVTCKAGKKPTVVAFVSADNEANRALIAKVNAALEDHKDAKLAGAVVIVGEGDAVNALKQYVETEGFKVPTACVAASAKELAKWKLDGEATNTVVLANEKTVKSVLTNTDADGVGGGVSDLCG